MKPIKKDMKKAKKNMLITYSNITPIIYTEGKDSGNIKIVINGSKVNNDYLKTIKPKIKKKIGREVSFLVNQKLDLNAIILYEKTTK